MVVGVDPELSGLQDTCCPRATAYLDLVRPLPLRHLLAVRDQPVGPELARQVLVERSAQSHVQDLQAPADPQHRHAPFQRVPEKGHLKGVPLGEGHAELGGGFLTVVARVEVCPNERAQRTLPDGLQVLFEGSRYSYYRGQRDHLPTTSQNLTYYDRRRVADDRGHRPEQEVTPRPDEARGLARLGGPLEEKGT